MSRYDTEQTAINELDRMLQEDMRDHQSIDMVVQYPGAHYPGER